MTLADEIWGTVALRPYVIAFLAIYLVLAARDLGRRGAAALLGWGWLVAFAAEYASTRAGVPFGLYHYTGETVGSELYLSNVPFFDSLSFPFLAYAAWCLARWRLGESRSPRVVGLAGLLMMCLDVVIDPVAVRGGQWFLGRIFYYPDGGVLFGVPLTNFAGWVAVGWLAVGGFVLMAGRRPAGSPAGGVALYYGVLAFNLIVAGWIREPALLALGLLLHLSLSVAVWRCYAVTGGLGRRTLPASGLRSAFE